jgi:serine/threonine protein kinase
MLRPYASFNYKQAINQHNIMIINGINYSNLPIIDPNRLAATPACSKKPSYCRECYGATSYLHSGLVFEYAPHDTLNQYLKKDAPSELKRLQLALDVLSALMFLHHHRIIFVDIHDMNILIDSHKHAKLCDLGAAIRLPENGNHLVQPEVVQVKTAWGAPESLCPQNTVSTQTDLYSFGMLLEFFYTQQQPRECMAHPNTDTQPADINTLRNASKTQITHPTVRALALNLCSLYAKDRPDAKHAHAVLTIARTDLQADSAQTRAGKKRFHSQI